MPDTGTVTFLFTDLVRSTELLGELGDEAAEQGTRSWDEAHAAGAELTLDQAIALALDSGHRLN